MCIVTENTPQAVKNGQLKLWKVIRTDNCIGIWGDTRNNDCFSFQIGKNAARSYTLHSENCRGQFHCFLTRREARVYNYHHKFRAVSWLGDQLKYTKVVRVSADSNDVVSVGVDEETGIRAISVSKMTIKSLKHQR